MDSEFSSLLKMETWDLIEQVPPNKNIVDSKWVFKLKCNPDGSILKYKARLVVRGFSQVEGEDYDETFAPVAKFSSIRTLLTLSASLDWEIDQMDVETAFLLAPLKDEIYLKLPEGLGNHSGKIVKLNKSLYGLKQAPRVWNSHINDYLTKLGFTPNPKDPCLYSGIFNNEQILLCLYVDDLIISCKSRPVLRWITSSRLTSWILPC
jgi:hypothetical protein